MSDTAALAHPQVLAALADANAGAAPSYGGDVWTARVRDQLRDVFETDLEVWLVASGTAANALALSILCPPTGAILCHREAHIERDERGAPEFFTGGAKLSLLDGPSARIEPVALGRRLAANQPDFVHETPAHVLALSNLTECGAAYTAAMTAELAGMAKAAGLGVFLDGARFANALVHVGARPADLSWRSGVDVMALGATKNGALGCEAILLFGEARARIGELRARAKRAGHMPAKMRFLAAQMLAWLEGDLWLDLARRANATARELADVLVRAGGRLAHPLEGNEVFVELPDAVRARLSGAGAGFYAWHDGSCRFVCSWATREEDVGAVESVLKL
jgi:threonine aldolase